MQRNDVFKWVDHHAKSLSSFRSWRGTQELDHIVQLWERPLTNVSYAEACEVTQRIVSGEVEKPWPDDTAATVRREAERARDKSQYNAQEVIRTNRGIECGLCKGTGMVTIWHVLLVKAVQEGVTRYRHPRTHEMFNARRPDGAFRDDKLVCSCKCKLGDRFANQTRMRHGIASPVMQRFGESQYHAAIIDRESGMSIEERIAADAEQFCPRVVSWAIDDGGF